MPRDTTYAQQALSANDTTFSIEALEDAENGTFERILTQLNSQPGLQQNVESPQAPNTSPDGTRTLYVSTVGYEALFATAPRTLYVPEGKGARTRPTNAVVDQVVLHSFGYAIDLAALRTGANSIQVDNRATGHNPYKVYQRLQQVLFSTRQATSHIITRRGDIISATPWNRAPAVNATGQGQRLHVAERSISIELESWHTAYNIAFRGTPDALFRTVGQMPYTPEQMTALAFILKKLGVWSNVNPTNPLGFTFSAVSNLVGTGGGHIPGIVNMSVLDRAQAGSPGGEFELPLGWAKGDPIPAHLDREAWERRLDVYYRSLSAGTRISHFDTVQGIYNGLPTYAIESELFEVRENVLYAPQQPQSGGVTAVSQIASNTRGEGFARSQAMQSSQRSGLYDAAPIANDALVTATNDQAARSAATAATTAAVPVIQNGLAFDFGQGRWVLASSTVQAGDHPAEAPTGVPEGEP